MTFNKSILVTQTVQLPMVLPPLLLQVAGVDVPASVTLCSLEAIAKFGLIRPKNDEILHVVCMDQRHQQARVPQHHRNSWTSCPRRITQDLDANYLPRHVVLPLSTTTTRHFDRWPCSLNLAPPLVTCPLR